MLIKMDQSILKHSYVLSVLILTANVGDSQYCLLWFTDEETEAQKDDICPESFG